MSGALRRFFARSVCADLMRRPQNRRRRSISQPMARKDVSPDVSAALRGGASLITLQLLGRLTSILFVLVVTRRLGPEEFGRYSIAAALVLIGTYASDFGTSPAITKLVSRSPNRADELLSTAVAASSILGVLAYGGLALFAVLSGYPSQTRTDILLATLAVPASSVATTVLGAVDGVGLIARRAVLVFVQTTIISLGGLWGVVVFGDIRPAVIALVLSSWVTLGLGCAVARHSGAWHWRLALQRGVLGELAGTAAPFAINAAMYVLVLRFDVVVMSLVSSASKTADYDLAERLLEGTTFLSAAIYGPMNFLLSRRIGEGDLLAAGRAYAVAGRALYLIGIPLSCLVGALSPQIIGLALGSGYHGAIAPLTILGAGQCLLFLTFLQTGLVNAGDHLARGLWVAAAVGGVVVVLDVLLIPTLGASGAALAMVGSWVVSALAYARFNHRTVGLRVPRPPRRLVAAAAIALGPLLGLRYAPAIAALPAGVSVMAAALVATGAVGREDLRLLRHGIRPNLGPVPE